jgi:hypothetical protein
MAAAATGSDAPEDVIRSHQFHQFTQPFAASNVASLAAAAAAAVAFPGLLQHPSGLPLHLGLGVGSTAGAGRIADATSSLAAFLASQSPPQGVVAAEGVMPYLPVAPAFPSHATMGATPAGGPLPLLQPPPAASLAVNVKQRRRYRHESFPEKLYRMLEEADREGKSNIVSFTPDGAALVIHRPAEFADEIVPRYFRHKKLSSFKRQLSMYGFERIAMGPNEGAFYHSMFRRGFPQLCQHIKRVSELELVVPAHGAAARAAAAATAAPKGPAER